jgi:hypothetical protein
MKRDYLCLDNFHAEGIDHSAHRKLNKRTNANILHNTVSYMADLDYITFETESDVPQQTIVGY